MSDAALKRMSLDEFLVWDDGTDTRYELIGGFPVAMAPGMEDHGVLAARLATRLENALVGRRPCRAIAEAGVLDPETGAICSLLSISASPAHPASEDGNT